MREPETFTGRICALLRECFLARAALFACLLMFALASVIPDPFAPAGVDLTNPPTSQFFVAGESDDGDNHPVVIGAAPLVVDAIPSAMPETGSQSLRPHKETQSWPFLATAFKARGPPTA